MPRVSIIIPTYNRKDYVQEAINSVLAQTYTDYEIIVVDDGSTDGTGKTLQARYGDRIRYLWQENQGESVARNRGVEMAQGDLIAFLDSDDLWLPEKLSTQIVHLDTHSNIGFVFSQAWQIDADGVKISDRKLNEGLQTASLTLEKLCFDNLIEAPSTVVVTKSALQTAGGFDPSIRYGEDYDLFLRLRLFTNMVIIPLPLACIRRHQGTQCYFPSPERNAQRREAHLSALDKLFASWTEASPELQRRAYGWQYAKSALLEAVAQNKAATNNCLKQAAALDPALLSDGDYFGLAVANQAAWLYESAEEHDPAPSMKFLAVVLDSLAETGHLSRSLRRKILSRSYLALGFTASREKNFKAVRYFFAKALIWDPRQLKNLGLLSLLLEATCGRQISAFTRRVLVGFVPRQTT